MGGWIMKNIFVSSTFVDFQEERDILRYTVLPFLNSMGRQFGQEYGFIDLRWGVNTLDMNEEESNREVLSVCLSEIDRCSPYMIVMLGSRYGYTPDLKIVYQILASHDETVANKMEYPDYDISVTELEILYRIHKEKGNLDHVWFFFRESDEDREHADPEDLAKMDALKAMILKIAPQRVLSYKKISSNESWKSDFGNLVATTLSTKLQEELQQMLLREEELNQRYAEYFVDSCYTPYTHQLEYERQTAIVEKISSFAALLRENTFWKVMRNLLQKEKMVLVRGPVGCGKTAFLVNATIYILNNTEYKASFISCMSSEELAHDKGVTDYIQGYLNRVNNPEQWIFVIDGIEKFAYIESIRLIKNLKNLCESKNIRVLLSAENSFFAPIDIPSNTLETLNENDVEAAIVCILENMGKRLSTDVMEALVHTFDETSYEESVNPLRLEMAITELTLMGEADYRKIRQLGDGMHAIRDYQLAKIQQMPRDLEHMFLHVIETICQVSFEAAWDVVCYLALSKNGLKEKDLIHIFEMNGKVLTSLNLSKLVNFLPSFFMYRKDGRIDFTHVCSRRALLQHMREKETITGYALNLVRYCESLTEKNSLKEEIWTLLLHAGEGEKFFEKLLESRRYDRLMAASYMMHWVLDFENPEEAGYLGVKDDWKRSIEYRMQYPPADNPIEQKMKVAMSCMRPPSCDRSLLDKALQKRVNLLIRTIEKIMNASYEQNKIQNILRFLGYEFPIAYHFETYEGRENSKRALCTLYVSLLCQEHLQKIVMENKTLQRNYVDAIRFACEVLLSTGFYKDKEVALEIINNTKRLIPNSEQIDVKLALAQLKKVEGDASFREEKPETYKIARSLYAQSHNELQKLLDFMKAGGFDGQPLRIDEISLVISKCKALFALAELLWEEGGNDNKSRAHELYEQMYEITEQRWKSYAQTGIEKQEIISEFAYMRSKICLALGTAYDNQLAYTQNQLLQIKWEALDWARKSIQSAQDVLDLRGQTVTAVEQLYTAYLKYAKIMYKIDENQYIQMNENFLYREINKWRRFVGCRESLLLEANYLDMLIECDNKKDIVKTAIMKEDYASRVNILRQQIEYADPMIDHLEFM